MLRAGVGSTRSIRATGKNSLGLPMLRHVCGKVGATSGTPSLRFHEVLQQFSIPMFKAALLTFQGVMAFRTKECAG